MDTHQPRRHPPRVLAPVGEIQNLWVGPLANIAKARPVTHVTDRSISSLYTWLYDNRHLVFFRERGGDENWQAHAVDLQTSDVRPLTPGLGVRAHVRASTGDLLGIDTSTDNRHWVAYVERDASSGRFCHYDGRTKTVRFLFSLV